MQLSIHLNINYNYNIEFINNIDELIKLLQHDYQYIMIDKNILSLYSQKFSQISPERIYSVQINEEDKNIQSAIEIINFLAQKNISKSDKIAIIGGGAFSDVTMFVMSIFKRGLSCTLIPTTLLSMVDASIGGKNAINFDFIKNLIGTIYLAQKNIIVSEFIQTLSNEQLLSGWAEVLKIALVKDSDFYEQCIKHLHRTLFPDDVIIQKAIQLKLDVIQKDAFDSGERQLLNYGHTIAHAIEGLYDEKGLYIPHGYAVIQGIIIENMIAQKLKLLSPTIVQQIHDDLKKFYSLHLIHEMMSKNIPLVLKKIQQDKKNTSEHTYLTLIENIGKGKIKVPVNITIIEEVLKASFNIF